MTTQRINDSTKALRGREIILKTQTMGYETRIAAFIEIPGLNSSIDSGNLDTGESNRILQSVNELKDFFIKLGVDSEIGRERELNPDTQIIEVSNGLAVSRLIRAESEFYSMISDCIHAIHLLIDNGFLCRGAIKVGNLFSLDTPLIGDAYIKAWLAESNDQLPIITFDGELLESVRYFRYPTNEGSAEFGLTSEIKNYKELMPGIYYLDYFTDYHDYVEGGGAAAHYLKLREIIVKGLQIPNANDKYRWAADQFNKTASKYGLDKIE